MLLVFMHIVLAIHFSSAYHLQSMRMAIAVVWTASVIVWLLVQYGILELLT